MRLVDLRRAGSDVVAEYVRLRNEHAERLLTEAVRLEETLRWLRTASVHALALVDDGALAGAVVLYEDRDWEIAVFVSVQGEGVGSRLVEEALNTAKGLGQDSVWAWVRADNVAARRLFEGCGFSPECEEAREYRGHRIAGIRYRWCQQ